MTEKEQESLIELGKRLRHFRTEKGYSQESLADETQLDRTYISGLERGKRNPSFLILKKIANSLDIPIEKIFNQEK